MHFTHHDQDKTSNIIHRHVKLASASVLGKEAGVLAGRCGQPGMHPHLDQREACPVKPLPDHCPGR